MIRWLISGQRPYFIKDFPQRFLAFRLLKKSISQNCQLSTVTLVTQKKSFLETVICYLLFVTQKNHFWKLSTVNCNAWDWCRLPVPVTPRVKREPVPQFWWEDVYTLGRTLKGLVADLRLLLIFIIFNPNIAYNLILLVVVGKAHLNACNHSICILFYISVLCIKR